MSKTENWWYCDNILDHRREVGLLHLGFPRVFILIRDEADAYFSSFEEFYDHIAELNFLDPEDRADANIEAILADAWNFMAKAEAEEERLCDEYRASEDDY